MLVFFKIDTMCLDGWHVGNLLLSQYSRFSTRGRPFQRKTSRELTAQADVAAAAAAAYIGICIEPFCPWMFSFL